MRNYLNCCRRCSLRFCLSRFLRNWFCLSRLLRNWFSAIVRWWFCQWIGLISFCHDRWMTLEELMTVTTWSWNGLCIFTSGESPPKSIWASVRMQPDIVDVSKQSMHLNECDSGLDDTMIVVSRHLSVCFYFSLLEFTWWHVLSTRIHDDENMCLSAPKRMRGKLKWSTT